MHFRIKGKGDKTRFVPVHPTAQRLIEEYLAVAKRGGAGQLRLGRPSFPSGEKQPHGDAGEASGARFRLSQHRQEIRT